MNKRNWLASLLFGVLAITTFQSCSSDDDTPDTGGDTGPTEWTRATVFPEDPRNGAASFVIGNDEAYVIGGFHSNNNTRFDDVWAFDGQQWTPKADFAGTPRYNAVGFSIDGKGFVGTGYDGSQALNDFYSYDSNTDTWTRIADFPGEARFGAVAFSLGGYGYVGLGSTPTDKTFSDFYRYDPNSDTWTLIPTNFAYKKVYAFAFVIGDRAYVGGGISNNQLPEDFYAFDGTTWTALNNLNRADENYTYDVRRYSSGAFSIGNYGYVVSGRSLGGVISTVWKYNPANDAWTGEHQALLGTARERAVSFSLGGRGYIVTGVNGSTFLDDNWQFLPVR